VPHVASVLFSPSSIEGGAAHLGLSENDLNPRLVYQARVVHYRSNLVLGPKWEADTKHVYIRELPDATVGVNDEG
jgi:hypothetical protein